MAKRVWRAGGIGWRMSRDDTCIVCVADAALISWAMSASKEMPGSSNWRESIPHHHMSNPLGEVGDLTPSSAFLPLHKVALWVHGSFSPWSPFRRPQSGTSAYSKSWPSRLRVTVALSV